jgi:MtN3 and saliva related transmembrane protein
MDLTELIGIIASIFTGIALLPQLIKIFKEKKAEGVSWLMLGSLFIGLTFWVIYGFKKEDYIIVVSNGFAWIVNITVFFLSMKYRRATNINRKVRQER